METSSIDQITVIGKTIAKYSFLIGTALFLIYCLTRYTPLIPAGIIYIVIAIVSNSITLLTILIMAVIYPKDYLKLLKTALIILLNLPIAYLYLLLITESPL